MFTVGNPFKKFFTVWFVASVIQVAAASLLACETWAVIVNVYSALSYKPFDLTSARLNVALILLFSSSNALNSSSEIFTHWVFESVPIDVLSGSVAAVV